MTGRLCVEYRAEANGTDARKRRRRGASNWFGLAGRVLPQRFVGEGIELARLKVLLELAIPGRPVKRQKPVPKLCKFLRGKSLDLVLESFHFVHDTSLAMPLQRRLTLGLSSGTAKPLTKSSLPFQVSCSLPKAMCRLLQAEARQASHSPIKGTDKPRQILFARRLGIS